MPLASTLSGLLLAARTSGSLAPEGVDPSSDIATSANRLLAGNPFPQDEPAVADGVHLYRDFKSPITIEPQGRVPIFWVQGFTDALFPALEALSMLNHVKATDPGYPFKLFLGDIGHDYAAERVDEMGSREGDRSTRSSTTTCAPTEHREPRPSMSVPRSPAASTTTHRCATNTHALGPTCTRAA